MKLSEARKTKGYSQEKLSREINVSLKHYQNIEHGIT
ncbi:helix-turn-helix domain-containing protein, partial [Rhizobium ruizarguesonis]